MSAQKKVEPQPIPMALVKAAKETRSPEVKKTIVEQLLALGHSAETVNALIDGQHGR